MTDKLNLQRLDSDPRLPMRGSIDFERVLYVRLYELFRAIAGVTNQNGEAISDAISNVTTQLTEDINQAVSNVSTQLTEDINQAIAGVTNQIDGIRSVVGTSGTGLAYAKIARVNDDTSVTFFFSGGGDFGSATRQNGFITAGSRRGTIDINFRSFTESVYSSKLKVFYQNLGNSSFDIWISKAVYNGPITLLSTSSNGVIQESLVWQAEKPAGAIEVSEGVFLHSGNTTVDGNGFIKRASPIIKLFSDSIEKTGHLEIEEVELERVDVGHYVLRNTPLLSRDGWYIETPKDRNNNIYFYLDYEENETDKTLTIKTYEPDYSTGRVTAGEPVDILEGRFVSLRFEEDTSLYTEQELDND